MCTYVCIYSCTLVHSDASSILEEWNGYSLNGKFHNIRSSNIFLHCMYVCMYVYIILDPIIFYYTLYVCMYICILKQY